MTNQQIMQALKNELMQAHKKNIPDFSPGCIIVVQIKIEDSGRTRLQSFEGLVIAMRHRGIYCSFTVRKISYGVGVERVFHLPSPLIESITVKRVGKVRRSKLYHMRSRTGRAARIKEKLPTKKTSKAMKEATATDISNTAEGQ